MRAAGFQMAERKRMNWKILEKSRVLELRSNIQNGEFGLRAEITSLASTILEIRNNIQNSEFGLRAKITSLASTV